MFKSTALATALLACVAINPASASSVENGWQINGIELNGVTPNGLRANGLRVNGLRTNGNLLQGISVQGVQRHGLDLDAAAPLRLIAIELPQ